MANRWHQKDFLKAIESRGKPVADIEQGYISTASCILANISMQLGRALDLGPENEQSRRRRRSQQAPPPPLPHAVGTPRAG